VVQKVRNVHHKKGMNMMKVKKLTFKQFMRR